ncbi:MAG: nicotinate-nucleotide adenylyltransferase, partial [Snowella sp.]
MNYSLTFSKNPKQIALFGTSADPPTAAHRAILEWLSAHYDWVAVWASDNPFKAHATSLKHRMAMLKLLIESMDTPQKNISFHEELSYLRSLLTLAKAKEIWGSEVEYTLVIGSDLIQQIRQWYRVEELLKQVRILIIPRPGYLINKEDLAALQAIRGNYAIADLKVPDISSTDYRETHDKTIISPVI